MEQMMGFGKNTNLVLVSYGFSLVLCPELLIPAGTTGSWLTDTTGRTSTQYSPKSFRCKVASPLPLPDSARLCGGGPVWQAQLGRW